MNILFLCDEYPPGRHGGIGTAVQLLARELVRKGHRVVVAGFYDWGYGGQDFFEDEGVQVYRFRRFFASALLNKRDRFVVKAVYKLLYLTRLLQWDVRRSLFRYAEFLKSLIQKYDIEIVEVPDFIDYVQYIHSPVYFPVLPVPYMVKLHGSGTYFCGEAGRPVPEHIFEPERRLLNGAAAVCSVSAYTAGKTAAYFGYSRPIHVLHNGIQIPDLPVQADKIPGRVIITGALTPVKGMASLMKAWNIVHSRMPDASLYIYGKGPAERFRSLLDRQAVPTVFFEGHVDRKYLFRQLAAAQVAVFPSYAECFALAPMEAMVQGTAVIYSSRTSGPELITPGENGLLVDPDDIAGIAGQIMYLLTNPEVRAQLAENGRRLIADRFDIRVIAAQQVQLYRDILGGD